jgi:hypothetical protein
MTADTLRLGPSAAAFAAAVVITVLFNTSLAWAKDVYRPLDHFMGSLTGHDWTTQGLADVVLFLGLGLAFRKAGWMEKTDPRRLISLLAAAVVVAGAGLCVWYALVRY